MSSPTRRPNVVFLFADQLRASALSAYGNDQVQTPNLDRLASQGVRLDNMISTCPVCTPYRSMLTMGRHPQTTGFVINSLRPRHSEISVADALNHAGYKTAWVGKWHLYTGGWPANNVPDWVPHGRPRMGFQHWRAYNQHMVYFDGPINSPTEDWAAATWDGYETDALNRYAFEFMDGCGDDEPFAVFVSPQPPHWTPYQFAPDVYYDRLPPHIEPPANLGESMRGQWDSEHRHYFAMILAVDDMVGDLMAYLDRTGRADNTLLVFTSDHGTQGGSHGVPFWGKKNPYDESFRVPLLARLPGVFEPGSRSDALTSPVDLMPTLLGLCGVPVPRTVEGRDLAAAWRNEPGAAENDALLTMNFGGHHDLFRDGGEWRGVRTKRYNYARWLDGRTVLHDVIADPLQLTNLAADPAAAALVAEMETKLAAIQARRGDVLQPCTAYAAWFDAFRRPIRNGYGPMPDPEAEPDWSLLA